jgi:hypothetical protein
VDHAQAPSSDLGCYWGSVRVGRLGASMPVIREPARFVYSISKLGCGRATRRTGAVAT